MDDGDRRVPEMRPAMQAASKARQQVLDAAEHARGRRRPPATPQEIALPLVNAVSYLVDAVIEQQTQIEKIEKLALASANTTQVLAKAWADSTEAGHEVNVAMLGALAVLADETQ